MTGAEAWSEVRSVARDRQSGAAQLARRAATALEILPPGEILEALAVLLAGHPSMAPLWRLGTCVLEAEEHPAAARRFVAALDRETEAAADAAVAALGSRVLTFSYTATVIEALARCGAERGISVACSLSEPEGEGARTADALRSRGVEADVLEDADALELVRSVDTVVVGADAVTPTSLVNKAGTKAVAAAAWVARVPFVVLAGELKFVGAEVPVVAPFERTPLTHVTAVASGGRLLGSREASGAALQRPVEPRLGALLAAFG
jgi:hypothetical protein